MSHLLSFWKKLNEIIHNYCMPRYCEMSAWVIQWSTSYCWSNPYEHQHFLKSLSYEFSQRLLTRCHGLVIKKQQQQNWFFSREQLFLSSISEAVKHFLRLVFQNMRQEEASWVARKLKPYQPQGKGAFSRIHVGIPV